MIDPIAASAFAVAQRTAAAPFLVWLSGVVSSFGPCVAPRFVALAACSAQARSPRALLAAFIGGLVAAYASFGCAASLFVVAHAASSKVYALVAAALFAGGAVTIVRADEGCCGAPSGRAPARSLGGVFLLGASFAFVLSPCCTPLVLMVLAYTSSVGDPLYGAGLLGAFGLGHALPLIALGAAGTGFASAVRRMIPEQAVSIASGALMVGLAGYYALLV